MILPMEAAADLPAETWTKLIGANSISVFFHALKKDEVMYLPTGHFVMERTLASPMIYGVRKSFFLSHVSASADYGFCLDLKGKDGGNLDKMHEVHSRLKAAVAELKKG